MMPAELGRFLRERFPDIRACLNAGLIGKSDMSDVSAALDCAMEVLREIASDLGWALDYVPEGMSRKNQAEPAKLRECKKRLATLRLVLGEGGEGEK